METNTNYKDQVMARRCRAPISLSMAMVLLTSTDAKARGGSGGAFGLEILFGLAILFAIWLLVGQVNRETWQMIIGYVIAAAVVLTVIQFIFNVLS
jgi:hypothetical protein